MNDDWKIKTVLGEAQAILAEAWFSYLGFLTLTALFHAVADKSGVMGFIAFKWICYLALWRWVMFKVDSLIWVMFPQVKPEPGKHIGSTAFFWSIFISTNIAGYSYFISFKAIELINQLGGS